MEQNSGKYRLIVVGNGPSALHKPIDSYDVVVRIGCFQLCEEVGSKVDIVLRRSWQPEHNVAETWIPEPLLTKDNIIPEARRLEQEGYDALFQKLNLPVGAQPSAGMIAIEMALTWYKDHHISICGFDFMEGGWYWEPGHSHVTEVLTHSPVHERILINKYTSNGLVTKI
jgi:hypothetical protein